MQLLSEFIKDKVEYIKEELDIYGYPVDVDMETEHLKAIISTFEYIQNNIPNIKEPECFYESDGLYGLLWCENNASFGVYVTWYGEFNYECSDCDLENNFSVN